MTKTIKKTVKRAPKYKLEVLVNDITYKGSGNDLAKTLQAFVDSKSYPFAVKTRAIIRYSKGKMERQRFYSAMDAKKIFKRMALKEHAVELLAIKLEQELV